MFKQFLKIPLRIICFLRSCYYSNMINEGSGKIIITKPFIKLRINKHSTSKLNIKGTLKISPFFGNNAILIHLKEHSTLQINNDFTIGQGVKIILTAESYLEIGGKEKETDSGITADTFILVKKRIIIGKDFVCSWQVFITDSDWHWIKGTEPDGEVVIGDHVWIANNNNILKGSDIGNNSIIASNSKVINRTFPENSLIGGVPARVLKSNIFWSKDKRI